MIRLAVRCQPAQAEAVLAELLVLAPGGVEEEQGTDYVEYAIYGAPGEIPDLGPLKAAVLNEAQGGARPPDADELIEVSSTEIPDDWAERWADFHQPVLVADRVWVRPSWEPPAADGLVDLVVDPGQAFGTGAHPTTRLCIELMVELEAEGHAEGPLADWGTGSGVLAITAAKLGWSPVTACDLEVAALDAAAANAKANGVSLELSRINLRQASPPPSPTVIANLTSPVLVEIADRLPLGETDVSSTFVCSGLLAVEVDSIAMALSEAGFTERKRKSLGEWAALQLAREA